jgi:glycosyltransferase involved in cell wall biosynthesis
MPVINALLTRGDEIVAVAEQDGCEIGLEDRGCRVINLSIDSQGINPLRDLALMMKLRQIYATEKPDIILNFTIKPVIFGTLSSKPLNIPVINTITGLGTAFINDTWLTWVVHRLYRWSLSGPRRVVFQNEEDLIFFKERALITGNPITIIPGSGVDLMKFRKVPVPRNEPVTFLLIARMLKHKGIYEFVEAARALKSPNARFQLLGPIGVANRTAISKIEVSKWVDEGIVEYLGHTDDIRPFVEQAHCIVLPSYREGMPRALIEAAAMGRPLIATRVAGCREVVRHEVNGYLCAPREALDLTRKLREFMKLSHMCRQKMGDASRDIAKHFDVKKVIESYLKLIDIELARTEA